MHHRGKAISFEGFLDTPERTWASQWNEAGIESLMMPHVGRKDVDLPNNLNIF